MNLASGKARTFEKRSFDSHVIDIKSGCAGRELKKNRFDKNMFCSVPKYLLFTHFTTRW